MPSLLWQGVLALDMLFPSLTAATNSAVELHIHFPAGLNSAIAEAFVPGNWRIGGHGLAAGCSALQSVLFL